MKKLLCGVAILGLGSAANAGLAFGELVFNPQLQGSGQIGDGGPYYISGLPAWVAPANQIDSLTSPITGIPGFAQFNGFVDSWAYETSPGGSVGFVYRIRLSNSGADRLVRAAVAPEGWDVLGIPGAGSDGSGNSFPMPGATSWTDGDPYFMYRDEDFGYPVWQFRLGNPGTVLNRNQSSALVWFETTATADQVTNLSDITLQDGGAVGGARIISVPEPVTLVMLLCGGLCTVLRRR